MFEIKLFICIFFILHSFSRENTKCSSLCLVQQQKVAAIFLKKNWNMLSLTESAIFQEFVNSGLKGMAYRLIHQSEYWPLLMWTIWKTIKFNLSNSFLAFLWHFHNKKYFFLKMSPSQTIVHCHSLQDCNEPTIKIKKSFLSTYIEFRYAFRRCFSISFSADFQQFFFQ